MTTKTDLMKEFREYRGQAIAGLLSRVCRGLDLERGSDVAAEYPPG